MRRQGRCFDSIISRDNLRLAFLKALRGKRGSKAALLFCRDVEAGLEDVRQRLLAPHPVWGPYRSLVITDPKERTISAAPFPERIMHHAIMNVLEPIFERPMIHHSYACRAGNGTHAAVLYAFRQCKAHPWFLKLDVRKYFNSIDHRILFERLQALLKDGPVLQLLRTLIASHHTAPGKGLPIGNLTSQFFANLYLADLDHYILEHLKPAAYVRYMDDFVLWADCKADLVILHAAILAFARNQLALTLKPPVLAATARGLPFLGFLIKPGGIHLMRKSRHRMITAARDIDADLTAGRISEAKAAERTASVNAAVALARTQALRLWLWHGRGLGHASTLATNRI
ncbi:MAG: reverse transcriptase/maturase family protein, partial [Spirochaetota bacterium]